MAKIVAEAVQLPKDAAPTAQQRTALITRLTALGLRGQDLAALIAPGKTRAAIVQDLIAHCRTLPKG
jgi:FixJ family two-component response regulator